MTVKKVALAAAFAAIATVALVAQTLPASPEGRAQTQVGGKWVKSGDEQAYQGGKWIELTYGRPILRGRTSIFGSGATYGQGVLAGAPVWRAGANVSTRLRTEVPLMFAGKMVQAGEYSVFIDLKEGAWTFILSSWDAQKKYDPSNKAALWGSYNYTPDKDVLRAPMKLSKNTATVEQLTWGFINMTAGGGELALWWEKEIATVAFMVH